MPRVQGKPPGHEQAPRDSGAPDLEMKKWVEDKINLGMITMMASANLPTGAMQLVKNATVRFDRTTRRFGSVLLVPEKPDSNPVLALSFIKDKAGNPYTIRFTPVSAHFIGVGAWTPITIAPALSGTSKDRFNTADVLDTLVVSNNGADPLQKVDLVAGTMAPLGNAPNYRYVTGFYNRAVGFARRSANEVEVGWSADGNPLEWDPNVNESAGNTPLLESPADLSDFIKGGYAFSNVMIILREKSIWIGTKQPIPQNPFYMYSAVPGIGCNCPFSVQLINNGLAWVDQRTKAIYAYTPGSAPEPIGRPIEKTLLAGVDDPDNVFSAYAPIPNEYTVYIPTVGSNFVQAWTYNFRTKAWTYNEYYALCSASDAELAIAGTRIKDLIGTIGDLQGTIASLSPSSAITTARSYGRTDGSIMVEDENQDRDAAHADFPAGVTFDTVLTSKTFKIPSNDIYIAQIVIEYTANRGGQFTLDYSKDDGKTWIQAKVVNPQVLGQPTLLFFRKMIRARRFTWRLITQAGQFESLSYEIWIYPSGASRR